MDSEVREATLTAATMLRELEADGRLSKDSLYKGLVSLALVFAEGNDLPQTTKLLLEVPVAYYRDVQPAQMKEDSDYASVCIALARLLVLYAMVDMGPVINQHPGVA